ncbi:hypothetical protein [Lacticaseibacillus yichunensis]|uniref:Phage protein n=1 Tax=Lacticaseibacillus yichunensis TaxID=2486015 RepID=A0ABW4CN65_9LACO|nr:hypothetical protein [Lacticaseibacillus yichunensis]
MKYQELDNVLLKDGRTATIMDITGTYTIDVGHSDATWGIEYVEDDDIERKLTIVEFNALYEKEKLADK